MYLLAASGAGLSAAMKGWMNAKTIPINYLLHPMNIDNHLQPTSCNATEQWVGILTDRLGNPAINVNKDDDESNHCQSPSQPHQSLMVLQYTNDKKLERS